MSRVDVAVFHRDGLEALSMGSGEKIARYAERVRDEMEARHAAVAYVDVTGTGAAVLDWLRDQGRAAFPVNRAAALASPLEKRPAAWPGAIDLHAIDADNTVVSHGTAQHPRR